MKPAFIILCILLLVYPYCIDVRGYHHHNDDDHDDVYGVKAIYQFGDSISDTGNLIRDNPKGADSTYAKLPYGQTYFHRPTGRCSDGLLMLDYFAEYFKLPFIEPYLKKDGNFSHGVNFAVAGSTALDVSTLAKKDISVSLTSSSLSVQLNWFRTHLNSFCNTPPDCKDKLRNALFIVGETGGNDINNALFEGKSSDYIRKMVPEVLQAIKNVVRQVIDVGAIRVVVPGNFPIGCMPVYLAGFKSNDSQMYDEIKCLKNMNDIAKFQNDQLQQVVKDLQQEYPHVAIVYADYFYALRNILRNATALGFDKNTTQKACCGTGNIYNFDWYRMCGFRGVPICPNPQTHISWDGIHLTSHAYQHMSESLIKQIVNGISHVDISSGNLHKGYQKLKFIFPFFSFLFLKRI